MEHCPIIRVHSFASLQLNKRNLPMNMESFIFDNLRFIKNNTEKSYPPKVTFMFIQL